MIELRRITAESVEAIFSNARPQDCVPHNAESVRRVREAEAAVVVHRDDGLPIVLAGVTRFPQPGMSAYGNVWAVVTEGARGHGLALTRMAKQVLGDWMKQLDFDALWTFTLLDSVENRRWMSVLGFVPGEGPGSVVLDDNGVAWKGYVLWEYSAAERRAVGAGNSSCLLPITGQCGSNTQAGRPT